MVDNLLGGPKRSRSKVVNRAECLRRLRELDPEVRVLISTGYTANSSIQKLVAEGAMGVVEKPFLPEDFAVAVRAALDKS